MTECGCYVAHGVEHLCELHQFQLATRADFWVEAELCRECICDELERLEAQIVVVQRRLRTARTPREALLPPDSSPFVIGDERGNTDDENHSDDDPEFHTGDDSAGVSPPDFI